MTKVTRNGINFTYNNGLVSSSLNGYIFLSLEFFGIFVFQKRPPERISNCQEQPHKNPHMVKIKGIYAFIIFLLYYFISCTRLFAPHCAKGTTTVDAHIFITLFVNSLLIVVCTETAIAFPYKFITFL